MYKCGKGNVITIVFVLKMDCVPVTVGKCATMSNTKQGVQEYKERMSSLMLQAVGNT